MRVVVVVVRGAGWRAGESCIFNGYSLLSPWQTCQASIVCDGEFPGVCALFTGSCRPTFCEAVGTLPDIRNSLERRQSHRYDHTDWSREKKGRILKVSVTHPCVHPLFSSQFFFVYPGKSRLSVHSLNGTVPPDRYTETLLSGATPVGGSGTLE